MKTVNFFITFIFLCSLFSCSHDDLKKQLSESDANSLAKITTGNNPYALGNMKLALEYLKNTKRFDPELFPDFEPKLTHRYIKLTPRTIDEEDQIHADTTVITLDYPLDLDFDEKILETRAELAENDFAVYYTCIPVKQSIKYSGVYEVLEDLYIPEQDSYFDNEDRDYVGTSDAIETKAQLLEELIFTAYFLKGLDYLLEDNSSPSINSVADKKPEKPKLMLVDKVLTLDDISQARFEELILQSNRWLFGKKWYPNGTIRYTDNSFAVNKVRPLPGIQILIRQGFTLRNAVTNANGQFSMGSVRGKARYVMQFERAKYNIKGKNGFQSEFYGPLVKNAPWNYTINYSDNYIDAVITYHALIHLACLDYYYGDRFKLTQPRNNIRIKARNTSSCTSSHVTLRKYYGGSDIILCKYKDVHAEIYGTTIHELAHSAHFQFNKAGYNKLVFEGYIDPWISLDESYKYPGPTARSARRTLETWASTVELMFVQKRYGLLNNGFSNKAELVGDRYEYLMQDMTASSTSFYTSCGFDLLDAYNQRTNERPYRVQDRVAGYTIKQLETSLYGAINWNKWRDNIKSQHTNNTAVFVDELFGNWN